MKGLLAPLWCLLILTTSCIGVYGLPKVYGVLLIPGFDPLDVFGPLEYINALPDTKVVLISESSLDPVWSGSRNATMATLSRVGEWILPTHTIATAPHLDVLVVVGGPGSRAILAGLLEPSIAFIAERYPSLQYLISICTGNALAATSGVLNGRSATGNKRSWAFVTGQGPLVNWVPKARWVVDENIWSSSGVEAGTDMIYSFIKEIYSENVANTIAKTIEHRPHTDPSFDPFADLYNTTGTLVPPPAIPAAVPGYPSSYGVIVYPGVSSLELWSTLDFLWSISIGVATNVSVIAATTSPIKTNIIESATSLPLPLGLPRGGQPLMPDYTFDNAPAFDVLVVPGAPAVPKNTQISAFIAARYPNLRHLMSVGTGSALVAQSGVLNGTRAATSKYFFSQVSWSYPYVQWVPGARWVVSQGGKVWSSSAGAAAMDMMNAFISQVFGPAYAQFACTNLEYVPDAVSGS